MINNFTLYSLTVLIWGTTWYVIKFQLGVVEPDVSVAYRFLLASVIMLVYCLVRNLKLRFSVFEHVFFLVQGFFLFCLNYILFYLAAVELTTGLIAVVFSGMLIFNTFNSALVFKTPITGSILLAALMGMTGITLIFLPELKSLSQTDKTLFALALSVAGTYSASVGNMVSIRNQRRQLPVLQANAWGMLYGALFTCVFAWMNGSAFVFDFRPAYIISLVYLSIFGSVIAFWCYLTLLGRIGAGNAAYATVLFPIVALLISTVFEGYQWSLLVFIGVLVSIAGNIIVLRKA